MQEIKKRRIVLASILKPVNDVRMYEKFAKSLHREGFRDIHIIGYPATLARDVEEGISFHRLSSFDRISIHRLAARWKILRMIFSLRPDILIVTTHELLMTAVLARLIMGTRIVYDIQENYYANIRASAAVPEIFRDLVARLVRLKEKLLVPHFDALWLAERCYADEMPFVEKRALVLENKCVVPENFVRQALPGLNLLFSGTLARSTGVFEAIGLAEKLRERNPVVRLIIAGYCAHKPTWSELEQRIHNKSYITVMGGTDLLPHRDIVDAISGSHFGIICYPGADHVRNRIPTKLYEYLACRLPILMENRKQWVAIADPVKGCIPVDFSNPDIESILQQVQHTGFCEGPIDDFLWHTEEQRMIESVVLLLG